MSKKIHDCEFNQDKALHVPEIMHDVLFSLEYLAFPSFFHLLSNIKNLFVGI